MKGIDVSQHNGNIDWDQVRNHIDFAILRLGWIGNKNNHTLDTKFERNYNECKRLGIPVGVYIYNYTVSKSAAESGANWTVNKLQGKSLELPVYIDMEDPSGAGLGKAVNTDIVIGFNSIIESSGRWAGVYASLDWFNNKLNKDYIKHKYTTWIAHVDYTNNQDKYKGQYDMFQYSWEGHVSGINSRVDMNILYRNLIKEIAGDNTPSKKSVDEIAREVINGEWGNGQDRRNRLEAAGYNYNEVQARVNELLGANNYYPACNSGYKSLVDALNSIGVDSSYNHRKAIAIKNGISNYKGTASQNNELLAKLKAGKLKRV